MGGVKVASPTGDTTTQSKSGFSRLDPLKRQMCAKRDIFYIFEIEISLRKNNIFYPFFFLAIGSTSESFISGEFLLFR